MMIFIQPEPAVVYNIIILLAILVISLAYGLYRLAYRKKRERFLSNPVGCKVKFYDEDVKKHYGTVTKMIDSTNAHVIEPGYEPHQVSLHRLKFVKRIYLSSRLACDELKNEVSKEMRIMLDNYVAHKKENTEKWLDDNCGNATMLGPQILPFAPDLGYHIKVANFNVYKDIFPDEYDQIVTAYFKMIKKMQKRYKDKCKPIKPE